MGKKPCRHLRFRLCVPHRTPASPRARNRQVTQRCKSTYLAVLIRLRPTDRPTDLPTDHGVVYVFDEGFLVLEHGLQYHEAGPFRNDQQGPSGTITQDLSERSPRTFRRDHDQGHYNLMATTDVEAGTTFAVRSRGKQQPMALR